MRMIPCGMLSALVLCGATAWAADPPAPNRIALPASVTDGVPPTSFAARPRPADVGGDPIVDLLRKVYASWRLPMQSGAPFPAAVPMTADALENAKGVRFQPRVSEAAGPLTPLMNLPARPAAP